MTYLTHFLCRRCLSSWLWTFVDKTDWACSFGSCPKGQVLRAQTHVRVAFSYALVHVLVHLSSCWFTPGSWPSCRPVFGVRGDLASPEVFTFGTRTPKWQSSSPVNDYRMLLFDTRCAFVSVRCFCYLAIEQFVAGTLLITVDLLLPV